LKFLNILYKATSYLSKANSRLHLLRQLKRAAVS